MGFLCSEHTMQFLGGVQEPADAWRTFASWLGIQQLTENAMFSVVTKSSGQWIGRVGPWTPYGWPVREVGWGLIEAAEGRGYALEAAVTCIDYVFNQKGWDRVSHLILDSNAPSQRLAEKLGSHPGGLTEMPGKLSGQAVRIWSQSREHWQAQRATFDTVVPRT